MADLDKLQMLNKQCELAASKFFENLELTAPAVIKSVEIFCREMSKILSLIDPEVFEKIAQETTRTAFEMGDQVSLIGFDHRGTVIKVDGGKFIVDFPNWTGTFPANMLTLVEAAAEYVERQL